MTVTETSQAPGRLGDPTMTLASDPRTEPGVLRALKPFGLDGELPPPDVTPASPPEAILEYLAGSHAAYEGVYGALPLALDGDEEIDAAVERSEKVVTGVDGNDITIHIFRPVGVDGPLPAVVYTHGGGMVIMNTINPVHVRWCTDLAASGIVAIAVDFRNGFQDGQLNPFPAGLNDCTSAIRWIAENRDELGISNLVLQGESGGANLTIATTMKAKQDGWVDKIDGVYATVPYISGGYGWDDGRKAAELPSLIENDAYFIACPHMAMLAYAYDRGVEHENPLAWPYFATASDFEGFPPHIVTVNELDPLRDEGLDYYRKLKEAGVPVIGRVNLGLCHVADLAFRKELKEIYWAGVADISEFAKRL